MADGIKAFFKEDLTPGRSDKSIFVIAPMISIICGISIFAVIPFGDEFTIPWTNWVVKLPASVMKQEQKG
jgi:NADH-quinone oxidoreductase subunit H